MTTAPAGFTYLDIRHRRGRKPLRRLPGLLAGALKLVWAAARAQFLISMALQLVGGVGLAVQLLAGKAILSRLTAKPDFGELVPFLVVLVVVSAFVSFANQARVLQQALLG